MRQTVHILSIVLIIFSLASSGALAQGPALTADDPTPPSSPVKLIFVHHSTGENWLADGNGNLGVTLRNNNYFVSDTNYGWGPDSIGDRTDLGHWWDWFRGEDSATYLAALYAESGQHSSYSRLAADPGGPNEIILFKSCFPNSAIGGNPTDPPTVGDNPMRGEWCCGESYTVGNVKGIYIDILQYFATRQDKLFVVIVTPPLTSGSTDASQAANARALANWLVNDWLDGYAYQNVAVFDFYNVLTSNGGSTNVNDLGATNGNHHRWRNGAVEHTKTVNSNYSAYGSSSGDSHPTAAGNQKASAEFAPLLNVFYHRWKASGPTSFGAPTIWLRNYARSAGGWTSQDVYPRMVGEVKVDGRADMVGCGSKGVYVALSTGSTFGAPALWINTFGKSAGGWTSQNTYPRMVGDVNNDGRADMVGCGNKGVYVALSTGSTFGAPALWVQQFGPSVGDWPNQNETPRVVGDANGDGRADVIGFGANGVQVALSTGSAFGAPTQWIATYGKSSGGWTSQDLYPRAVGDADGDGDADVVGFGNAGTYVSPAE